MERWHGGQDRDAALIAACCRRTPSRCTVYSQRNAGRAGSRATRPAGGRPLCWRFSDSSSLRPHRQNARIRTTGKEPTRLPPRTYYPFRCRGRNAPARCVHDNGPVRGHRRCWNPTSDPQRRRRAQRERHSRGSRVSVGDPDDIPSKRSHAGHGVSGRDTKYQCGYIDIVASVARHQDALTSPSLVIAPRARLQSPEFAVRSKRGSP
jgi:hypothetical protein